MAHPGRPRKVPNELNHISIDIANEKFDLVELIITKYGINATDAVGRTALINTIIERKFSFAERLIQVGADVNARDQIGYSALHFAVHNDCIDYVKLLLSNGANPNIQDIHGNSPLWTYFFNEKKHAKDSEITKLLLKGGASPNSTNKYGKTAGEMYQIFTGQDISQVYY